jgi:exodeoxyribonuclease V alpha subunit
VDAVIVDEMSMVDSATFYHLITAIPSTTVVVLVGDPAQLPSVGAGYVLNNLMRSSYISHVSLTQIYRQEEQSDIVGVAHSILAGRSVNTTFNDKSEFVFLPFDRDSVLSEICKLTAIMKGKKTNFQVIAPMYDGDLGVNNLNSRLRGVLNSEFISGRASKIKHGTSDLYEGDRVMIIKNDYDRMIFNGDVGKVQRISIRDDKVDVRVFDWFDHESQSPRYIDKVFTFTIEEARFLLKVAFACTAHKVQGQEFDFVLLPMTISYRHMLYRNLLYTAITRAKKKVFVFGDPRAFSYAVSNDRETVRNSALIDLIDEYLQVA